MMESKVAPHNYDDDLEEGLCSDSSVGSYTPLPRPKLITTQTANSADKISTHMDADDDDDGGRSGSGGGAGAGTGAITDGDGTLQNTAVDGESNSPNETASSSDESSDNCLKKLTPIDKCKSRKRVKRTVMVRLEPNCDSQKQNKARFKKYDIWTTALQEDALTETMRGCDVNRSKYNDRNVENYDLSLRACSNGRHVLKRRRSNSFDDLSDDQQHCSKSHSSKKLRHSNRDDYQGQRKPLRDRLGKRYRNLRRGSSTASSSADSTAYEARHIADINENVKENAIALAQEMAMKLQESKDDLLVRIIEILGTELPLQIYKETQRIEAEGGMAIKNGKRRRTPGGVFLFLLKHHDTISDEDKKAIFIDDRQQTQKKQKQMQHRMRQRKVEELKKCLTEQSAELPAFSARKEPMLLGDDIDNQKPPVNNLSNPPPSPEVIEQSPDYKSLAINHVSTDEDANDIDDKPSTSHDVQFTSCDNKQLSPYEDDCLDINYGDIEFF